MKRIIIATALLVMHFASKCTGESVVIVIPIFPVLKDLLYVRTNCQFSALVKVLALFMTHKWEASVGSGSMLPKNCLNRNLSEKWCFS